MKWIYLHVLFCLCTIWNTFGQVPQLSEQAEISVITCSPGEAIFEAFGHSAIRVHDPVLGFDYAYNYGVFDFDTDLPLFIINFIKGHLLYKLGRGGFKRFAVYYAYNNRTITQQTLNLSQEQKQEIFEYLEVNNLPENQEYLYDYYYNNCATKIRDVLQEVITDTRQLQGIVWEDIYKDQPSSIRQLQNSYLKEMPWGRLGINLAMGPKIDQIAASYEYMYLPEYVLQSIDSALITSLVMGQFNTAPLVKEKKILNAGLIEEEKNQTLWSLWVLLLAVILFSIWHYTKGLAFAYFDVLLFLLAGIGGSILLSLWLFTDHTATTNNFNVLWLLPTHLPAAILLPFYYRKHGLQRYFRISTVVIFLTLISWPLLHQQLLIDFLPLMIILLIRAAYIGFVPHVKAHA